MVERRSMGAAASITPDKLAFIQVGPRGGEFRPPPAAEISPTLSHPAQEIPSDETEANHTTLKVPPHKRRVPRSSRSSISNNEKIDPLSGLQHILVQLTTRLQPTTVAALRRASLEQRLRGLEPATVQEIVEAALQKWLQEQQVAD